MERYDQLTCKSHKVGNRFHWLGNLRWYVTEEKVGTFSFQCISNLPGMTHDECVDANMTKELWKAVAVGSTSDWRIFGADYIRTDGFTIYMPFYEYGCLICLEQDLYVSFEGDVHINEDVCVVQTGVYFVAFKTDAVFSLKNNRILICAGRRRWLAVTFGIDEKKVIQICKTLFAKREKILVDNKAFWNAYLDSCPTVELSQEYVYQHKTLGIEEHYSTQEFLIRQLWHYWCLLVNVSELEFNTFPLYMAPDKINWKGTWSNDGPQCMAALSLTNQKELSKRLIVRYLTNAMTENGVFSWYMHADGVACYGEKGDVGRFSHGDPYMPQVVEYYIRNTDDESILSADVGGMTVYEKLKQYMLNLHLQRDMNQDSLIEWSNLWETGWDDKGGTFFSTAALTEWTEMISKGTDGEITAFYEKNQRPVIAVVEQVIALWSFTAMARLAVRQGDEKLKEYCNSTVERMRHAVEERCWNKKDAFYYDIDVKTETQTVEKSADAFYWLNFETNRERAEALLKHLNDENEFHCRYVPMLSKDSVGFDPFGYWCGGHWPREMSFIAMGLHRFGFDEKAKELLVRAIMVAEGNIIPEVIEPIGGQPSTYPARIACSIMNVVAFLDLTEKVKWCNGNEAEE